MTTDIYSPSNPSDCCALDDNDIQQQIFWCHSKPSYGGGGTASHFDPLNPEQSFYNCPPYSSSPLVFEPCFSRTYPGDHTKFVPYNPENFDPQSFFFGDSPPSSGEGEPAKLDPCDPELDPRNPNLLDDTPEQSFRNWPPVSSTPWVHKPCFARTYPGDHTKFVPYDPENFDPQSFFFGGSSPSLGEPSKFDPCDPKIHPQDPKLLDDGFDDQFPAKFDLSYPVIGVRDDQAPDLKDASGNSKGKSTTVESIGTAANKWNKKESASVNKAALNTTGEEETGGRDDGEEFSSRETGHFARKCSLGADGGKSGGHGGDRALCTRMS